MEILSGLAETSRVVTLGQHTLKAGAAVRITDADTELWIEGGVTPEEAPAAA